MKKTKRVKYDVQCANNEKHIFEYVFTIIEGSETKESDVEAYLLYCDKFVGIIIKGIVISDYIFRGLGFNFRNWMFDH